MKVTSDIKKNNDFITKFVRVVDNKHESLLKKMLKMAENQNLDIAVYTF